MVEALEDRLAPSVTLTNPGSQYNDDGDAINFSVTAVDTDPNPLNFNAVNLLPGLAIDPNTGVITGTIAKNADINCPYSVTVIAAGTLQTAGKGVTTLFWKRVLTRFPAYRPGAPSRGSGRLCLEGTLRAVIGSTSGTDTFVDLHQSCGF
jgi:hypothetical protein